MSASSSVVLQMKRFSTTLGSVADHAPLLFKRRRFVVTSLVLLCLIFFLGAQFDALSSASSKISTTLGLHHWFGPKNQLHLLIPATSSGLDLCRLLLSARVLGYPTPVLIDWHAEGEFNAAETHLAKIFGVLRYLRNFGPEQDDDLMLIVDGFDVWFQVRPDVMIKRYYAVNKAANKQLVKDYGEAVVEANDVKQTVIWGPDKLCWPHDVWRTACWAVPDSPMPKDAFGPLTDLDDFDMEHMRPRWLNSGTVMGPVKDIRATFNATFEYIRAYYNSENEVKESDQLYISTLWGDQEYARNLLRGGHPLSNTTVRADDGLEYTRESPIIELGSQWEYHNGLDYESLLFQTAAGYRPYLGWFTESDHFSVLEPAFKDYSIKLDYRAKVPKDILDSPPPFKVGELNQKNKLKIAHGVVVADDALPVEKTWKDVNLGVNYITGYVFGLFHNTGDKRLKDIWWDRMWFFPWAEPLLTLAASAPQEMLVKTPDGKEWWNHVDPRYEAGRKGSEKGGAIADYGEWLPWNDLCQAHEYVLYGRHLYEPSPAPPPPPPIPVLDPTPMPAPSIALPKPPGKPAKVNPEKMPLEDTKDEVLPEDFFQEPPLPEADVHEAAEPDADVPEHPTPDTELPPADPGIAVPDAEETVPNMDLTAEETVPNMDLTPEEIAQAAGDLKEADVVEPPLAQPAPPVPEVDSTEPQTADPTSPLGNIMQPRPHALPVVPAESGGPTPPWLKESESWEDVRQPQRRTP